MKNIALNVKKHFPLQIFGKQLVKKDGYYKYCKECRKEHRKEAEDFRKCTKYEIIKNKEEFSKLKY